MSDSPNIELIDTLQSVEMAEGVEVKTPVAGPFPRAMALLIDTVFMFLLFFAFMIICIIIAGILGLSEGAMTGFVGLILIALFLFVWFYNFFFERGKKAATWGKRMYGLKVVSVDGTRATSRQIFIRNILRAADYLPGVPLAMLVLDNEIAFLFMATGIGLLPVGSYGIGLACCFFTKKFQRVGDLVANTVVVHTRVQTHSVAPLPPAVIAKIPRLPLQREEEVAIRSFCERAGIWSVARREEMVQYAAELTNKQGEAAIEEIVAYSRWISERS